jgi:excisionase family DNA binding protein
MTPSSIELETISQEPNPREGSGRMTIPEIASRLNIGRLAVYALLEKGEIPAIRLGKRWIVTRYAYANWERTCGMNSVMSPIQ